LFTEENLTKNQYTKIRTQVKHKTADTYSNYHKLRASKEGYPYKEANVIADCAAETKLQALLDSRLFKAQEDVITNLSEDEWHVYPRRFSIDFTSGG
jgi:hypothetical protein